MDYKMISVEYRKNVAIVKLQRSITNPINLEFVHELTDVFQKIKDDSEVHGLVLGSSNDKFFSLGFDIPSLFELNEHDFKVYYQSFNRMCLSLYTLPVPTIASITGHAIAGGCILALCCDYRFIAEGKKLMGLNEVKLGVPVPYPADCILKCLVGIRDAREIMELGEFYRPEELLGLGMVDTILPLEEVLNASIQKADEFATLPREAFNVIKRNRVGSVEEQILKRLEEKEQIFIELWFSEEARTLLKEAMKKF